MRTLLVILFSGVIFNFSYSQTATLTKGETIEYLNKKLKSTIGYDFHNVNGYIGNISDAQVSKDGEDIKISYTYSKSNKTWNTFKFNPGRISSITYAENKTSSSINELFINLIGNVCITARGDGIYYNNKTPVTTNAISYARFLYLKADPEEFNKIKKAFLYLKSLYKAEDDPFAN
jgi:hypothetical protein